MFHSFGEFIQSPIQLLISLALDVFSLGYFYLGKWLQRYDRQLLFPNETGLVLFVAKWFWVEVFTLGAYAYAYAYGDSTLPHTEIFLIVISILNFVLLLFWIAASVFMLLILTYVYIYKKHSHMRKQ